MAKVIKGKNTGKPWTARYQHEGRQREKSFTTWREADDFVAKFEHDRRCSQAYTSAANETVARQKEIPYPPRIGLPLRLVPPCEVV